MKWLSLPTVIFPLFFILPTEARVTNTSLDSCFIQAGKRYQIAPDLLKTIAQQESSLVATAINHIDWPPESPDNQYHLNK